LDLHNSVGHHDHLLFDDSVNHDVGDGHRLLRSRLQSSRLVGLRPHGLNSVHDLRFLDKEGLAEINGPLKIMIHLGQDLRHLGHRLDVFVPRLHGEIGAVVGVFHKPGRQNDIQRIHSGWQDGGHQGVGIKGNRGDQLLKLSGGSLGRSRGRGRSFGGCSRLDRSRLNLARSGHHTHSCRARRRFLGEGGPGQHTNQQEDATLRFHFMAFSLYNLWT
jgi:hypothetical protein